MERVLGYARISVSHEDIENQVRAIEEFCRAKGYDLLAVLKDTVTGITNPMDRPEFRRLLEISEALGIRKVVVYDVSRLGRSLGEIYSVLRILGERGIVVEFVRHNELSSMDPKSFKIMLTTLGLAAELEREFMRQRLEAARASGKRIGRPPVPIPVNEVKKYLQMGLTKKDVYRLLVGKGLLRGKNGKPLSYEQFLRRLKAEGIE